MKYLIILLLALTLGSISTIQHSADSIPQLTKKGTPVSNFVFPIPEGESLKRNGRIVLSTSFYDYQGQKGRQHWDIPVRVGTELRAISSGVIVQQGYEKGHAGMYIVLMTDSGHRVVYGHCRAINPFSALTGMKVRKGEVIAFSGNTGNSTGAHLHLQIFKGVKAIPPIKLLGGKYHVRVR